MSLVDKNKKWKDLREKLVGSDGLYEEVLQKYSGWLNSFYEFFGVDDFGQAKVDPPPQNPTSEEIKQWTATNDLAFKINFLREQVFEKPRIIEDQLLSDEVYTLVGGGGLGSDEPWPREQDLNSESFHNDVLAPLVKNLIEDIKVIQENPIVASGETKYFSFGTATPLANPELFDESLDLAGEYLQEFPGLSGYTLKKEIAPLPETSGKSPAPILSDINLENSLNIDLSYAHYIGLLLDPKMTNRTSANRYSSPYLPVRYSPYEDPNATSWDDENYALVEIYGAQLKQVKTKNKNSRGIIVPLGMGITVTEIVESETGTWVGFVSDKVPSMATKSNKKVLYTKAEYVRIRESAISSRPDPYISKGIADTEPDVGKIANIKGAQQVNPKENQNWISLSPHDVRLQRYDFSEHNKKSSKKDLIFTSETISKNPSLRYSHGDYYFIRGEIPRISEEEIIQNSDENIEGDEAALEAKKKEISAGTINSLKTEAWKNLLNYFSKHYDLQDKVQEQLFEKYFVIAAAKVNTSSVNPNNQKVLFAIRSSYIDALPEKKTSYLEDFDEIEKQFAGGNNFATTIRLSEFNSIVDDLVGKFEDIKSKIQNSNTKVQNPNNVDYDVVEQIKILKDLPNIFNRFFARQGHPASTKNDMISKMISEGTNTKEDHIIQIGIKDNNVVGADVRETISYVLFSPSPDALRNLEKKESFNLFYFDPFWQGSATELGTQRSARPLRTGLRLLREEFAGVYGSRALHLLFSYNGFKAKLKEKEDDRWIEFLQGYSVPPLKIFPSLDPTKIEKGEDITCEEIIRRLNNTGPVTGPEERRLQQLLIDKKCAEGKGYWSKFKNGTPALDPSLSKASLEEVAQNNKNKGDTSLMNNQYIKILYHKFFNVLDPQALISLIMACIQKKLGMPLTAEAICEAAIVELVKNLGISQVEQIMLSNAMLSPGSELSVNALNALGAGPDSDSYVAKIADGEPLYDSDGNPIEYTDLDASWNNSPVATALVVAGSTESAIVLEAIKNLEKSGGTIELVPGRRPSGEGSFSVPYGASTVSALEDLFGFSEDENGDPYIAVPDHYTQGEIDSEIQRLMGQGYSRSEAEAELVASGMLVPSAQQYESVLSGQIVTKPIKELGVTLGGATGAGLAATAQDAENWLSYMKNAISLGGLCELIVGEVLEGLENLITDPGSFSFSNWGASFLDRLKRRFSPPSPTMRFPDSLKTDSHMGDYAELLFKTLLSMVASILGQIVELLIRQALEACLEEAPGPGPEPPVPSSGPPIPLPDIQRANLPEIGAVPRADVASWIKDLMDHMSVQQLCALLRGDASKQTLYDCLVRTRSRWPVIIDNGIDSISDISSAFKMIGETLNLEICSLIQAVNPVEDLCEAVFDYDARCAQLKESGLTEEECERQIEEEISDLKSKVSGMVPLLFDQTNPLSSAPSMCEIEGAFKVPDGVQDTLDRVTDNMLGHVKGSLIQDLSTLKFFSIPPRAVLALGDRSELEKAHNIFADIKLAPDVQLCIAPVLPLLWQDHVAGGINPVVPPTYPLVYNQYLHFGGHSTFRYLQEGGLQKSVNVVHQSAASPEESAPGEASDIFVSTHDGMISTTAGFKGNWVDLKLETSQFLRRIGNSAGHGVSGDVDGFMDSNKIQPATILSLLSKKDLGRGPNTITAPVHEQKPRFKEIVNILRGLIKEHNLNGFTDAEIDLAEDWQICDIAYTLRHSLYQIIRDDMAKIPSPPYVSKALLSPSDVISLNDGRSVGGVMGPQEHRQRLLNKSDNDAKWLTARGPRHPQAMNQVWSLDTKLRDVRNDALSWYPMITMFTGIDIRYWDHNVNVPTDASGITANMMSGRNSYDNDHSSRNWHAFPGKILKLEDENLKEDWAAFATNYYGGEILINPWDALGDGQSTSVDKNLNSLYLKMMNTNQQGYKEGMKHWMYWLARSPGLMKLYRICQNQRYLNGNGPLYKSPADGGGNYKPSAYKTWGSDKHKDSELHSVADAFMELTVGEALGLTPSRIKRIMPNLNANIKGVIFGEASHWANVCQENDAGLGGTDNHYEPKKVQNPRGIAAGMHPFYIVFEEQSLSGKTKNLDGLVDHFKMDKDKVNQKLYDALAVSSYFVPSIAGVDTSGSLHLPTKEQQNKDFYDIDSDHSKLFNPNILLYSFPFSDVLNQNVDGSVSEVGGAAFDGAATTNDILQIFKEGLSEFGLDQVSEMLASMDGLNKSQSLIYQNVLVSVSDHITSQLEEIKDVLTISKGKVANTGSMSIPASVIKDDRQILEEKLMFKHKKTFDEDIAGLLRDVYGGDFNYEKLREIYTNDFKTIQDAVLESELDILPDPVLVNGAPKEGLSYKETLTTSNGPYKLDSLNFKAQMFGEFLTHKFIKAFDKYSMTQEDSQAFPISKDEFQRRLKYVLATYGYSSLQYAYSSQMFSKLRGSRLQNRGFMKKLWNAILKSPLTSKADPRCQAALNEMSLVAKSDINDTETDFFNLDLIKPEIKKIYTRSLCADVYEKKEGESPFPGTEQLGAAQISLLEGMVILLIKVYVLELCLASVIAWDSFDLTDILQDELVTEMIVSNIIKDEYDIEFISYFCNDIIRKREDLTDVEKYKAITSHRSALKYIIEQEAVFIAATVKNIFKFSNPLSLDLSLDVMRTSDPDFIKEYELSETSPFSSPAAFSSLYNATKQDYVVDARMPSNVYTMNYGDGEQQEFLPISGQGFDTTTAMPKNSDIFGYFSNSANHNKNLFHSLPMTHYTSHGEVIGPNGNKIPGHIPGLGLHAKDSIYEAKDSKITEFLVGKIKPPEDWSELWSDSAGSPRINMFWDAQFSKYTSLQRNALGGADPWKKENFGEILFGGPLNAKLGNITINPYVRIELETECEKYNFKKYIDPSSGEPCDDPQFDGEITACSDVVKTAISELHAIMKEDNIFNSYIDGYVPLSVWSYFYNNIFLEKVNTIKEEATGIYPLRELYVKFGLKPFFKEISFGLRLSYSTSYPVFQAKDLKFTEFMQASQFGSAPYNEGLKKVKSLFGTRPYSLPTQEESGENDAGLLREIQIPIVEIEREITFQEGTFGFTIDNEQTLYSMNDLGYWIPTGPGTAWDSFPVSDADQKPENFLSDSGQEVLKFLTNTPDQFFYKNLATGLLDDLKNTPEFRLMFDHLLPMRKYMALSFIYAGEGLSKFIAEPTDILDLTKDGIRTIWENLINSADYKHMPTKISNMMEGYLMRSQGGTRGKEPDMTKQILEIIYRTPLLILKGFVEVTDPAVIIAKTIIDVATAVQQATISAVEGALRTAKQIAEATRDAALASVQQMKVKVGIDLAQANISKMMLQNSPAVPQELKDGIELDVSDENIANWKLQAPASIEGYEEDMTATDITNWSNFKEKFDSLVSLKEEIFEAEKKINSLNEEITGLNEQLNTTVKEAKDTMKDVFGSPFLLPGLWFSMLPSMTPYMGGIIPPGFPGGPPSTPAGMIYIALLLIDAIEEKMDDDINKTKTEPNCDSEL